MHLENEFKQIGDSSFGSLDFEERNKYEEVRYNPSGFCNFPGFYRPVLNLKEIRALRQQLMSLSPRGSSDSLDRPDPADTSLSESNLQYKNWKNQR